LGTLAGLDAAVRSASTGVAHSSYRRCDEKGGVPRGMIMTKEDSKG
jgi:hypothetical protein